MDVIQDIPKLYTALAEWLACLVFVLVLKRRWKVLPTAVILAASLILLCIVQYFIGIVPVALWIPGMVVALLLMYGTLLFCCKGSFADIGFYWAIAFISAEFAASVEWQFYSFYTRQFESSLLTQGFFLFFFYGVVFGSMYALQKKRLEAVRDLHVAPKEAISAGIVAIGAFLISNISYVNNHTPLSGTIGAEVFYIRTLVDFAGDILLLSLQDRWRDMQLQMELDSIHQLLERQYEQYRLSRENIEAINRKYHDLKHQIGIIRLETSATKREEYLNQLEFGIQGIGSMQKTGNDVLDTILFSKQLYCAKHHITLTSVVDGKQLAFIEVMDICSIFGNALDNAIESARKLKDAQKRLIRMAVFTQNAFLMIRVENYFEDSLQIEEGELKTTKEDKAYHGFGIKSIRFTAEKYGGSVSVEAKDNWFYLRVLLPMK